MAKNYSEEVKEIIKRYKKEDIEFGKEIDFLLNRIRVNKIEIEEEILGCKNLSFVQKQIKNSEIRYALFFIYGKRKGRKYVITFRKSKLRVITIFPLGRRTIKKYRKKGLNI